MTTQNRKSIRGVWTGNTPPPTTWSGIVEVTDPAIIEVIEQHAAALGLTEYKLACDISERDGKIVLVATVVPA